MEERCEGRKDVKWGIIGEGEDLSEQCDGHFIPSRQRREGTEKGGGFLTLLCPSQGIFFARCPK